jgi:hypothetical protein
MRPFAIEDDTTVVCYNHFTKIFSSFDLVDYLTIFRIDQLEFYTRDIDKRWEQGRAECEKSPLSSSDLN